VPIFFLKKYFFFSILVLGLLSAPFFVLAAGVFSSTTDDGIQVNLEVTCPGGVCTTTVSGCTDPRANNYNSLATVDDGSCTYNPIVTDIVGCTDPEAINYNPNATVDNGSCRYNIPNVSDFTAVKRGSDGARLTWSLPTNYSRFSAVIIIKAAGRIPTGITDGEIIYNGAGTSVNDSGLQIGVTYYYLALVRSITNGYSSGAITSYRPTEEPVEPPVEPPVLPPGIHDPFSSLPRASSTATTTLKDYLFLVYQAGEPIKQFYNDGQVSIRGDKLMTISIPYFRLPEVLKTIGISLSPISNPELSYSFILHLNEDRTAYEATISPFSDSGMYLASVYFINYQDQTIFKYTGQLAVVGSLDFLNSLAARTAKNVIGPVLVTGGVAAGIFQLSVLFSNIASVSDFIILLIRQFGLLLSLLGLKKRNKPWGTIYDSVTKQPIDPAYITVLASGKTVATAITDIDGRYGFSLSAGDYNLSPAKTHYRFPSVILANKNQDELYGNLYFGETIHNTAGEVINRNIPLDPVGFDWNEFIKSKSNFFNLYTKKEIRRNRIVHTLFWLGFVLSIMYLLFYPGIINLVVLVLYLGIGLTERYWHGWHKTITIKSATGDPASFAIVRIFQTDLNQEIKKVVADMLGRFYLLVQPGNYYLTVDHKQPDGSYARIYQSPPTFLSKGIWNKNITI